MGLVGGRMWDDCEDQRGDSIPWALRDSQGSAFQAVLYLLASSILDLEQDTVHKGSRDAQFVPRSRSATVWLCCPANTTARPTQSSPRGPQLVCHDFLGR